MESKPKTAASLAEIDSMWNPQDPALTETALRALLPASSEPAHSIFVLTWLSRAQAAQQKFGEARQSLESAEQKLNQEDASYPVAVKIRWLLEQGRLYTLEKTPSRARALFAEAWTLSTNSAEDHLAIEVAQMMAATEPQKVQQAWIAEAIQIAENSPMPKAKQALGSLYTTMGWKFYDLRQFEKALELFQKALRSLKAHGAEREAFVAQVSIGKVLRALGRTEEALAIQKTLIAELGIGGRRDGRLYEEVAECLQSLQRTTEAQLYFELAYRELSNDEWVTDNQPLKLKRLKDLGKVKSDPAKAKS